MPFSEQDTQELRRLLYLKAKGIERQEWLQYLRQTWKSSIWSEEDDDSYTLPDPEIPLVYSLHYGQQCPPEWDDGSVRAETADRQKKKEHGKSNLYAEEDFLQKLESLNLYPRLKKLQITFEEVFGALPSPLSCKKLVQMDLKLIMPFGVANAPALFQELMNKILYILRRRPLVQELISRGAEMEADIDDVSLGTKTQEDHVLLLREFFIVCQLPYDWLLTMVRSTRKPRTTQGVFLTWKIPWSVLPNAGTRPKWTNALVFCRWT